jgi:hypothetical protein
MSDEYKKSQMILLPRSYNSSRNRFAREYIGALWRLEKFVMQSKNEPFDDVES